MPKTPRQPDGVLVDPQPAVPESRPRAPALGVVTLEPPIASDAIFSIVTKIFDAFGRRSTSELPALFVTGDIVVLDGHKTRNEITQSWEQRSRNPDLQLIRGLEVVRIERMDRFDYDELSAISNPPRPPDMQPGDVLVRLPVVAPVGNSGTKLFPDVMFMVVRPVDRVLRIAGIALEP
jgi:hypothetical protein